jgi:N6-L-threonylcarbamoyladenine synthase
VRRQVDALQPDRSLTARDIADIAADFEASVVAVLRDRVARAVEQTAGPAPGAPLVVAGGVAANRAIRAALGDLAEGHGRSFVAPPLRLCADNGAMIAWAGLERLRAGESSPFSVKARPRWPLDAAAARPGAKA